jgi:hypothetical protein
MPPHSPGDRPPEGGPVVKAAAGRRPASRRDELTARTTVYLTLIDRLFAAFKYFCWTVFGCSCVAGVTISIWVMAGRDTNFRSVIDWTARMNVSEYAAWIASGVLGLGWVKERRARKKVTQEVGRLVEKTERTTDPERSSSGLQPDGSNPPGDE